MLYIYRYILNVTKRERGRGVSVPGIRGDICTQTTNVHGGGKGKGGGNACGDLCFIFFFFVVTYSNNTKRCTRYYDLSNCPPGARR